MECFEAMSNLKAGKNMINKIKNKILNLSLVAI